MTRLVKSIIASDATPVNKEVEKVSLLREKVLVYCSGKMSAYYEV